MRIRMDDETVIDTDRATQYWEERKVFDGHNMVSVHAARFNHQTLYRSRRGRYYILHTSQWQGSQDRAEWVSNERAAAWLLLNKDEIPTELQEAAETVSE